MPMRRYSHSSGDGALVLSPGGDFEYDSSGFSAAGRYREDGSNLELQIISTSKGRRDGWTAGRTVVVTIEEGAVIIAADRLPLDGYEADPAAAYRSAVREPERDFFRAPSGRRYSCEQLSRVMELGLRDDGCFVFNERSGTEITATATGTYREQDGWLILFVEKIGGFVLGLREGEEAKLPYRTGAFILEDRYALSPG